MNRLTRVNRLVPILVAGLLVACGDASQEQQAADEHVWKDQVEALEKAQAVEQTLMESDARRREAIDAQGQ